MSPDRIPLAQSSSPPRISRRALIVIYLLTSFSIAWLFWLLVWFSTKGVLSLPLTPVLIVGSFGPFIAAALCTWLQGGPGFLLRFFARGLQWRMGWRVFLLSIGLAPLLAIVVEAIHARTAHVPIHFLMTWSDFPLAYLWLLFLGGAFAEEFGWSYLSDRFDTYMSPTRAAFVLGAIWACWHLPLFYIIAPGLTQAYTPFPIFLVTLISQRFLFSWCYHKSGGSILSNILFHNAVNVAFDIVNIAATPEDPSLQKVLLFAGFTAVSAAGIWLRFPLSRSQAGRSSRR